MLAIKFILLITSVFIGYFLGFFLTEYIDFTRWKATNFKALTCRACLSFHIAWVSATITALLMHDWWMVLWGIIFALFLFVGLKIDEEEKTVTLDEWEKMSKNICLKENDDDID